MITKYKFGRPKRRNLDQDKIKKFLNSIDFTTEKIQQEWRHLIAFGIYQNKKTVFKLASTIKTSEKTKNEFYWNEAIHLTADKHRKYFTVPQNYSSGNYNKLFYFICQQFESKPLISPNSTHTQNLSRHLKQIARATYELENLPIPNRCNFAKSSKSKRQNQIPIGERLLASSMEWASQVPLNLNKYIYELENKKHSLKTCVGHGDFVPRQLYPINKKIGIIDGEHAGLKGPLYYDVAQFYLRLSRDHNANKLAQEYLLQFKSLLSNKDKQIFWEDLKPVLIQRYIGDLWGAKSSSEILKSYKKLGNEILNNKII